MCVAIKYQPPPPLPPNHICRRGLLEELESKLLNSTLDITSVGPTVTVVGVGGFGKTTVVKSLCHQENVKKNFKDGFVFVELGPQVADAALELHHIYYQLSGKQYPQGNINHIIKEVRNLTSHQCKLLVIIDDVWQIEDAQPLIEAFSNCKIVLTTRMNDLDSLIPSRETVTVGPMEITEAMSLLTNGIIDNDKLLQEDIKVVNELAQDVHSWPILLSLVRGQLCHCIKHYNLSYHEAIKNVQTRLYDNGLTAFDRNNASAKYRQYAVKACIDLTLDFFAEQQMEQHTHRLKSLILDTGIGSSLPSSILHLLWNVNKQQGQDTIDKLWSYGLLSFTNIIIPPHNNKQHCVEVHAVISQYVFDNMSTEEAADIVNNELYFSTNVIKREMAENFYKSYGLQQHASNAEKLQFVQSKILHSTFPNHIRYIKMCAINEPHNVLMLLKKIKELLQNYMPVVMQLFNNEFKSIMDECHQLLKNVHKLTRSLHQKAHRCLYEKNYDGFLKVILDYCKNYPLWSVGRKCVELVGKVLLYCEGELLHEIKTTHELFFLHVSDYHGFFTRLIPDLKLHNVLLRKISSALDTKSEDIDVLSHYFESGEFNEQMELIDTNHFIKLQEVAPMFVSMQWKPT